jgi:hypothetical protein
MVFMLDQSLHFIWQLNFSKKNRVGIDFFYLDLTNVMKVILSYNITIKKR